MTRPTTRCVAPQPKAGPGTGSRGTSEHAPAQGVVCAQDPARMTPEARLAELGAILARGFRRLREKSSNPLADRAQCEPACEPGAVDSPENAVDQEAI